MGEEPGQFSAAVVGGFSVQQSWCVCSPFRRLFGLVWELVYGGVTEFSRDVSGGRGGV